MRSAASILVAGLLILSCGSARGATYAVVACGDAPGFANNSWTESNNDVGHGQLETGNACGVATPYGGLYSRDALTCASSCSAIPSASAASWQFAAPTGTRIERLSYARWLYKDGNEWDVALRADDKNVPGESCAIAYPSTDCAVGQPGGVRTTIDGLNTLGISIRILCTQNQFNNCVGGATLHEVAAVLYGATVTLSDASSPTVSNVGGSIFAGGYLTGQRAATFDASDNAGVRSATLVVDGGAQPVTTYGCDFTYTVPCSQRSGGSLSLDTRTLSDGPHSVSVAATDPAGNEAVSSARTVVVDNTAPAAPTSLTVDGDDGWRSSNSFAVTWTPPSGQVAPVSSAHFQICAVDGSSCTSDQRVAGAGMTISGLAVPSTGEWRLRVWLEDAAGNVDPRNAATATLRYGSAPVTSSDQPTAPADSTTTQTTPGVTAPSADSPLTQPLQRLTLAPRLTPDLKIISARFSHGRLVIRGRTATGATGRVTIVLGKHATARQAVRGGGFRIVIRLDTRPRTVKVCFGPSRQHFAAHTRRITVTA